jgi:hypothetical protein
MPKDEMLVVRNVSKKIYLKLKQRAVEENITVGEAVEEAIDNWLKFQQNTRKPDINNITKLCGLVKTKKGNWSTSIDKMLYG